MKVLVIAYACEPEKGSEPGVGWNWVKMISKFSETWVITRANNKDAIGKAVAEENLSNIHFEYIDLPETFRFWKKGERGLYLYYLLWQIMTFRLAIKLNKNYKFDAIWYLTFGNVLMSTFLPFLGKKFIWGPIGGGEKIPCGFFKFFSLQGKIREILRILVQIANKFNPLFHFSCSRANLILVRTNDTMNYISQLYHKKIILVSETGLEEKSIYEIEEFNLMDDQEIKLVSVGRLIYWKGFDLLLEVLAELKRRNLRKKWKCYVLGDGPEKPRLLKKVKELAIGDVVEFKGKVSPKEVHNFLKSGQIFLFMSLKEGGSWALIEAVLYGLVPVAIDLGGNRLILGDAGFLLEPKEPHKIINEAAEITAKLIDDNDFLKNKRKDVLKRRQEITWQKKEEVVKKVFEIVFYRNEHPNHP